MRKQSRGEERLAKFIRERRKELDITQDTLSERLGYKTRNFISMVETGATQFPFERWADYADALEVRRVEFLRLVIRARYPEMLEFIEFRGVDEAQPVEPEFDDDGD